MGVDRTASFDCPPKGLGAEENESDSKLVIKDRRNNNG